jgi:hypothetical protein
MKAFFTELVARWKAPSPDFFRKLNNLGKSLIASGAMVFSPEAITAVYPGITFKMPETLITLATHLIVAGVVVSAVAKITVKDPNQIDSNK